MFLSLKIDFKDGILYVTITGEYSIDSAKLKFHEIIDSAKQHSAEKVLIDTRGVQNYNPTIVEGFSYAEYVSSEMKKNKMKLKLAYLHNPGSISKLMKFAENVAVN